MKKNLAHQKNKLIKNKSKQRNPHSRINVIVLSQNFIFSKKFVFVLETHHRWTGQIKPHNLSHVRSQMANHIYKTPSRQHVDECLLRELTDTHRLSWLQTLSPQVSAADRSLWFPWIWDKQAARGQCFFQLCELMKPCRPATLLGFCRCMVVTF